MLEILRKVSNAVHQGLVDDDLQETALSNTDIALYHEVCVMVTPGASGTLQLICKSWSRKRDRMRF